MTQNDLARRIGPKTTSLDVSRWEKGDSMPRDENTMKICKVLGCRPADLFHEEAA